MAAPKIIVCRPSQLVNINALQSSPASEIADCYCSHRISTAWSLVCILYYVLVHTFICHVFGHVTHTVCSMTYNILIPTVNSIRLTVLCYWYTFNFLNLLPLSSFGLMGCILRYLNIFVDHPGISHILFFAFWDCRLAYCKLIPCFG